MSRLPAIVAGVLALAAAGPAPPVAGPAPPAAGPARPAGFAVVIAPPPRVRFHDAWTLGSRVTPGCPVRIPSALVQPNAWNLRPNVRGAACIPSATPVGGSTGAISWSSAARALTMSAAFDHTARRNPAVPVAAYPELVYGWSPFLGLASPQAPRPRFPISLWSLVVPRTPNPVLTTDYSLCGSCLDRNLIDFSYDLFISRNRFPRWCGHGSPPPSGCARPPADVIEVMIWLAHSVDFQPAGHVASPGVFSSAARLGSREQRLRFRIYRCTTCSHVLVSFVLAGATGRALPRGLVGGSVSLVLDDFLAQAVHVLRAPPRGYLNGIELGSEIAPHRDGQSTRFWWRLRRYCLTSGARRCA